MNPLERDLTYKLVMDLKKALQHYTEMCEAVDIPPQNQWANIIYTLSRLLIELVQLGSSMPKESFLSMLDGLWDSRRKRKEPRK